MQSFCCPCLNIVGNTSEAPENVNNTKLIANTLRSNLEKDKTFTSAHELLKTAILVKNCLVAIRYDSLLIRHKFEDWTFVYCVNCQTTVYGELMPAKMFLLNANLLCDETQINTMKNDSFSRLFEIILKPFDQLPLLQIDINSDKRVKSLYTKLQGFISKDYSDTEEEIRRLRLEMHQRREQAERDFQRIAKLIGYTLESTKSSADDNNALTPPVTPESDDKTEKIGEAKKYSGVKSVAKMIPMKSTPIAIDFEDDIFDIDEISDDDKIDSDDPSDDEDTETVGKRTYSRNRYSANINIARSAPMAMPQFSAHPMHVADERAETDQQLDIASSIKMLARSIHVDSVFGELPNRPILRNNSEF